MTNLREWKKTLKESVEETLDEYDGFVPDHPPCPQCGTIMNFWGHDENGDFPTGEGYWKCPNCNFTVWEKNL